MAELLTLFEGVAVEDGPTGYRPVHDDEPCRKLVDELRREIVSRNRSAVDWSGVGSQEGGSDGAFGPETAAPQGQAPPLLDTEALVALLMNPEEAAASLPEAEQEEHRRCVQSIIDAAHWFRP